MTNQNRAIEEQRRECRRRWVEARDQWRMWRHINHDRQGPSERTQLSVELRCKDGARTRMMEAAAARMSMTARAKRAAVNSSCPAPGWAALRWTAEHPRASGVWWWWNGDKRCQPECVEIRSDVVTDALYGSPTMVFHGLTRVRVCNRVGGWWAGPVESPEPPSAATPPSFGSAANEIRPAEPESGASPLPRTGGERGAGDDNLCRGSKVGPLPTVAAV